MPNPNSPEKDARHEWMMCDDCTQELESVNARRIFSGDYLHLCDDCAKDHAMYVEPTEQVTLGDGEPKHDIYSPSERRQIVRDFMMLPHYEQLNLMKEFSGLSLCDQDDIAYFTAGFAEARRIGKINPLMTRIVEITEQRKKDGWDERPQRVATPPTAGASETGLPPLDITDEELDTAMAYMEGGGLGAMEIAEWLCRARQLLTAQAERDAALEERDMLRRNGQKMLKTLGDAVDGWAARCKTAESDANALRGEVERLEKEREFDRMMAMHCKVQHPLHGTKVQACINCQQQAHLNGSMLAWVHSSDGSIWCHSAELAQLKAGKGEADEDLYFIQDMRSYTGNSVMWWCPEGKGYTSELSKAWKVPREKALRMMKHRPDVDRAWPVAAIEAGQQSHFDMQKLRNLTPLSSQPSAEVELREEKS